MAGSFIRFWLLVFVTLGLPTNSGHAETPAEAFQRGQDDARRLLDAFLKGVEDATKDHVSGQPAGAVDPAVEKDLGAKQQHVVALYQAGEFKTALALCDELLGEIEAAYGRRSREYSATLGSIKGGILQEMGDYEGSIELYRDAMEITRDVSGPQSTYYAQDLNNLADLLRVAGRLKEADAMLAEAVRIAGSVSTPEAAQLHAGALTSRGEVLRGLGRYEEAEKVLNEALGIAKSPPVESTTIVFGAVSNRSLVYMNQGRYALALEKLDQLLPIIESLPPQSALVGLLVQSNRAALLALLGRHHEAIALARANVALIEKAFPQATQWQAKMRAALGSILVASGKADEGVPLVEESLRTLMEPGQRLADLVAPALNEQSFYNLYLSALAQGGSSDPDFLGQAIEHITGTAAARATRQTGLRLAAQNPAVSADIRRLQDLENDIVSRRKAMFGANETRDQIARRKQIDDLMKQRDTLLGSIEQRFAGFRQLATEATFSIAGIQASLRPDEALVWIITLPQPAPLVGDVYVWVVTAETSKLVPLQTKAKDIEHEVAALRCGLDARAWKIDTAAHKARCQGFPEQMIPEHEFRRLRWLPFDAKRAHELYKSMFGAIEPLLAGKTHLVLVPSGALTRLPFQALVVEPPQDLPLKSLHWLARDRAISVMPAVSSLVALRSNINKNAASEKLIGFGNPLLDGNLADEPYRSRNEKKAKLAREIQSCPVTPQQEEVALRSATELLGPVPPADPASTVADAAKIRGLWSPLPDTAVELCSVARDLAVEPAEIYLGSRATESEIKGLSREARLAQYGVLHFATHGALPTQVEGTAEPGLILTPPKTGSPDDDGFLTASEIAGLSLNADWAILSACNTAGPESVDADRGAETLSGLARAFFYAGARSLLVSHWEVDSRATVKLVSRAVSKASDGATGRAEALRAAMLSLIDSADGDTDYLAHPTYWAPFVLVGEGALH